MIASTTSTRAAPALDDDHLDRVLGALADRTRRAMLERLALGPAIVSELAEPFAMSLPAVSKHVKVLERAGLIDRVVEGRTHVCTMRPQAYGDVEAWLRFYRTFWEGTLDSLADFAERDDGEAG
jgi:DNA-binding transcriptional ArsR family regulator